MIGEKGREDTACLPPFLGDRDSTSRHTPGEQDSFEPAVPGPINGLRHCRVRKSDVADGKIWLFAARDLAKREPTE